MGVAMWPWAGLYAPQLPKILLFAVTAALYNEFPKFFRVVIGHAKTDIWLQQLFWLRPFFDPSGPKNPFFYLFFDGASWILPWMDFQFFAKIWSAWTWYLPTAKNQRVRMHIFNELWAILSGALFFLFCWFLLSFSSLDSYLTLVGWQKNIFNNFGMHTAHSAHYCCPNPAGKLILVFAPCIFLICTSIDALSFLTSWAIENSKILGLRKEVAWINKLYRKIKMIADRHFQTHISL